MENIVKMYSFCTQYRSRKYDSWVKVVIDNNTITNWYQVYYKWYQCIDWYSYAGELNLVHSDIRQIVGQISTRTVTLPERKTGAISFDTPG